MKIFIRIWLSVMIDINENYLLKIKFTHVRHKRLLLNHIYYNFEYNLKSCSDLSQMINK